MKIHEKIRFIRQSKGWSQEEMANKKKRVCYFNNRKKKLLF